MCQLYCDEVIQPSLQSDINNATRPSDATYSVDTFRTVTSGLAKEAGWAANVFALCRLLADAYYDASSQTAPIESIVTEVQNVVDPPRSSILGSWLGVMDVQPQPASAIGYFANEEEAASPPRSTTSPPSVTSPTTVSGKGQVPVACQRPADQGGRSATGARRGDPAAPGDLCDR